MAGIRIITPEAILSYPVLFEPRADKKGNLKYSCALVFTAGTDISAMMQAIEQAAIEKFGDKAPALLKKGRLKSPLRDDWDEKGYPEDSIFFNARATRKPGVVAAYADPRTGKPAVISDPDAVYPGQIVRASVTFYGFDVEGNKGVAVGLNNIQILRDGDRLDSGRAAQDEFDAVAPAPDLSDLDDDPLADLA